MEKRKLLIADSAEEFCMALEDALRGSFQVRTAADGNEALELLCSFIPDVLVLDVLMPGLDGISLLQRAAERNVRPVVLATTRLWSEYVLKKLEQMGVSYVMAKPCDVNAAAERLLEMSLQINPAVPVYRDPKDTVSNILLHLGVSTKLNGYGYLCEAIQIFAEDPGQTITKELYCAVGDTCCASPTQVERSIRSAMQKAWVNRDERVWQRYFPAAAGDTFRRPTNREFISRLALEITGKTEE